MTINLHNKRTYYRYLIRENKLPKTELEQLRDIGFENSLPNTWYKKYQELVEYKNLHGHCDLKNSEGSLGKWCSRQRTIKNSGKLSIDRINLLNRLEFPWGMFDAIWNQKFQKLESHYNQHGNCIIPKSNGSLSSWCVRQRILYKRGELEPTHIKILNKINFDWTPLELKWDKAYKELINFRKKHGHCNVPRMYPLLGAWVSNQRTWKRVGKLLKKRIKLLNDIGFIWSA
jgi:hypothetical protein